MITRGIIRCTSVDKVEMYNDGLDHKVVFTMKHRRDACHGRKDLCKRWHCQRVVVCWHITASTRDMKVLGIAALKLIMISEFGLRNLKN